MVLASHQKGGARMRVLYDDAAFNQPYGGVTKYFVELIKNLPDGCSADLAVRTTQNFFLQKPPFNFRKATHTQWNFWPRLNFRGKWLIYRFLAQTLRIIPSCEYENRRLFVKKLKAGNFDVLHITDPHKYTFEWAHVVGQKPIVMTVHDLIPDMNPRNVRIRRNRAKALRLVDRIIAVSKNTKQDIVKMYGINPEKISVVYHGADDLPKNVAMTPYRDMKYLLYVGGRRGYKNFSFFAHVVAQLMKVRPDLNLVCTGGELSASESKPFLEMGVMDRVHAQYVKQSDFASLYANALAFIYPSKYEGFGIPIVDAFSAGCPVILARSSCFPEVGGDAALYFGVNSEDELRACICNVIDHPEVRGRMIACGKIRSKNFTWRHCAESTAQVYCSVLKKSDPNKT